MEEEVIVQRAILTSYLVVYPLCIFLLQPMPPIEHNGQQFKYILTIQREGQGLDQVTPVTISEWSQFRYEKQTNDIFTPYLITIKANNEAGDSTAPVQEYRGFSAEDSKCLDAISISNL